MIFALKSICFQHHDFIYATSESHKFIIRFLLISEFAHSFNMSAINVSIIHVIPCITVSMLSLNTLMEMRCLPSVFPMAPTYCADAIVFDSIVFKFIAVMQCESEFIFILISYFEFPVEFTDYFHEIAVIERITMEFTPFSNIHIPTIIIMDWHCTLLPAESFVDFT